jgi:hypothetical protein
MTFQPEKEKKEKQFHIPLNPSRNPKPRVETRSWIPESPEKGIPYPEKRQPVSSQSQQIKRTR